MRNLYRIAALLTLAVMTAPLFAADITLPPPQKTGGKGMFESLDKRNSAGQSTFPMGGISRQDLSTILWAASGQNRDGGKWTVPMAMGKPPYCKIYVTTEDGVYFYDWKEHKLVEVATEDVREAVPLQQFAQKAPVCLYFIVDGKGVASMSEPLSEEGGPVLAGAMSQNVYLACESLNIGTRMIYSIKRDAAKRLFDLADDDVPLFALPMGKR